MALYMLHDPVIKILIVRAELQQVDNRPYRVEYENHDITVLCYVSFSCYVVGEIIDLNQCYCTDSRLTHGHSLLRIRR